MGLLQKQGPARAVSRTFGGKPEPEHTPAPGAGAAAAGVWAQARRHRRAPCILEHHLSCGGQCLSKQRAYIAPPSHSRSYQQPQHCGQQALQPLGLRGRLRARGWQLARRLARRYQGGRAWRPRRLPTQQQVGQGLLPRTEFMGCWS